MNTVLIFLIGLWAFYEAGKLLLPLLGRQRETRVSHRSLLVPIAPDGGYREVFQWPSRTGWMSTAELRLVDCTRCSETYWAAIHPTEHRWYWAEPHENCDLFHDDYLLWTTGLRSSNLNPTLSGP